MRSRAAQLIQSFSRRSRCTAHQQTCSDSVRRLHIQATPSSTNPTIEDPSTNTSDLAAPNAQDSPDVRFEVLGPASSLLSVSLSASQNLYTRRGTLVGVSGSPEHAVSTLSPLEPLRRAPLGIPWLYQRIASSTPMGLLIASKGSQTCFSVVNLDGRVDWKVTQRNGLMAWSGHNLTVKPTLDTRFSLAHWGNTTLTGRGLVALAGTGQIYQVKLNAGEQYVAHPGNVLAYSMNINPPQPYRFKSSSLRFEIPSFGNLLPDTMFVRNMRQTATFRTIAQALFKIRTWARTTIWGDRLFIRFYGPTTVLLQSRGSWIRDVLTNRDVNEIADTPAGSVQEAVTLSLRQDVTAAGGSSTKSKAAPTGVSYASIGQDGKVTFGKR